MHGSGCAWWGQGGFCAWQGACMVGAGGLLCVAEGHAWQGGVHGRGRTWQGGVCVMADTRDTVNERAVRILLECILFFRDFSLLSVNSKSSAWTSEGK